jgi:hypothetical protein
MTESQWTYKIKVNWSEGDGEYVASVPVFPSVSWLDTTERKAVAGCLRIVADILEDMEND